MALKDVVKVNRKTFFDPRAWLGYDILKAQTKSVWGVVKGFFVTANAETEEVVEPETFEQAKIRLNLTDTDIKEVGDNYFLFAWVFLGISILLFCFAWYLLFSGTFAGFLIALSLCGFLGAQAFRNHFLYFQIKHRKLGCTFEEWRRGRPNNEDTSA